jgi:hypothetical protein
MVCAAKVANCVLVVAAYSLALLQRLTHALSVRSEACGALGAYTQFATWAAVDCVARHAVTREGEAGEAHRKSAGNERVSRGCRVKRKTLWGPSGRNKNWRCEPLSFAYFSLRRQRKVGAAPHRGDA